MIFSEDGSRFFLKQLLQRFENLNLYPVIGAEIEFYLISKTGQLQELDLEIEAEKGEGQFEVRTVHSGDIFQQIETINDLKQKIEKQALKQNMIADFGAKPFTDQPGSGLHIHLHLENEKGENLYIKKNDQETEILLHSIGGLCATMEENMLIFAPYEEAYLRYRGDSLESPCKICWGGNNRSAAIRMPLDQKFNRRLEHRVACSDSSPIEVICAILHGVFKGIKERIAPPEKLYGNAFLEQYNYPIITQSLEVAKKNFKML